MSNIAIDDLKDLADRPSPESGSICDDGCECPIPTACVSSKRCERIVCWTCPYQDDCQADPITRDFYGDAYNCDVTPGIGCLAGK